MGWALGAAGQEASAAVEKGNMKREGRKVVVVRNVGRAGGEESGAAAGAAQLLSADPG